MEEGGQHNRGKGVVFQRFPPKASVLRKWSYHDRGWKSNNGFITFAHVSLRPEKKGFQLSPPPIRENTLCCKPGGRWQFLPASAADIDDFDGPKTVACIDPASWGGVAVHWRFCFFLFCLLEESSFLLPSVWMLIRFWRFIKHSSHLMSVFLWISLSKCEAWTESLTAIAFWSIFKSILFIGMMLFSVNLNKSF